MRARVGHLGGRREVSPASMGMDAWWTRPRQARIERRGPGGRRGPRPTDPGRKERPRHREKQGSPKSRSRQQLKNGSTCRRVDRTDEAMVGDHTSASVADAPRGGVALTRCMRSLLLLTCRTDYFRRAVVAICIRSNTVSGQDSVEQREAELHPSNLHDCQGPQFGQLRSPLAG